MAYWLLAPFALLLLAWPYILFFEARRLDTRVKEFAYRFGREDVSLLLMLLLYNGAAAFTLYAAIAELFTHESIKDDLSGKLVVGMIALPFLSFAFIVNRLHFSYWHHERHARLEIDELEQHARYNNKEIHLIFAVSEVVSIVRYSASQYRRAPWNGYEYEVYTLQDGTEFIITCLLYYSTNPAKLFPTSQRNTVQRRICWLPETRF